MDSLHRLYPDSIFTHSPACNSMRSLSGPSAHRTCGVIFQQSSHQTNWCSTITNLFVSTTQNGIICDTGRVRYVALCDWDGLIQWRPEGDGELSR